MTVDPMEGVTSNSTTTAAGEVAREHDPDVLAVGSRTVQRVVQLIGQLAHGHGPTTRRGPARRWPIGEQSQSLTEADVNGGAGVLRPRTGVRR
jgi:hypothetical protein